MPLDLSDKIIAHDMETVYLSADWSALKTKSIYVSGAGGMLASYLVLFLIYLNEKHDFGITIYAGIRNGSKAKHRFGEYSERDYFVLIPGDVVTARLPDVCIDYIIHAASPASPQYYGGMPVETMLPNVVGTYRLLEWARNRSIIGMLYFSSGAVYGDIKDTCRIAEKQCGEFDFLAAGSVYGESKRCGEALCAAYFREYGVHVRSVRIHHTYGPTLDLVSDKRAFAEFVKNIVDGKNIVLKSDGSQMRAFAYITDALTALLTILLKGADGESYNFANDYEFVNIRQLAETLVSLYPEKRLKVVYGERADSGYLNLAQSNFVPCDISKLRALGVYPTVSISDGFKRTIDYFLSHKRF